MTVHDRHHHHAETFFFTHTHFARPRTTPNDVDKYDDDRARRERKKDDVNDDVRRVCVVGRYVEKPRDRTTLFLQKPKILREVDESAAQTLGDKLDPRWSISLQVTQPGCVQHGTDIGSVYL